MRTLRLCTYLSCTTRSCKTLSWSALCSMTVFWTAVFWTPMFWTAVLLSGCGPASISQQVEQIRADRYASYQQLERTVEQLRREVAAARDAVRRDSGALESLDKETRRDGRAQLTALRKQLRKLKQQERELETARADAARQEALARDINRLEDELRLLECEVFEGSC